MPETCTVTKMDSGHFVRVENDGQLVGKLLIPNWVHSDALIEILADRGEIEDVPNDDGDGCCKGTAEATTETTGTDASPAATAEEQPPCPPESSSTPPSEESGAEAPTSSSQS